MTATFLSVVGPTATGKTAFALELAEKLSSQFSRIDIISADSRQVYKGMEIGSGVDIPADFAQQLDPAFTYPFFVKDHIFLHGASIILPNQEWSVASFQEMVKNILFNTKDQHTLVLFVGGTGLYHTHVFSDDPQLHISPDEKVRKKAEHMSVEELQKWLQELDNEKISAMNTSDRANPRRLIRAIEIAAHKFSDSEIRENQEKYENKSSQKHNNAQVLTMGLNDSIEHIEEKIAQRIETRLKTGMIEEVQSLIANYTDQEWKLPAFSATGYKEVRAYLEGMITLEQLKELWQKRERQYAKRQLTWWKKIQDIQWFSVSSAEWKKDAFLLIENWLHVHAL